MKQHLRDDPFDSIPARNPGKIYYALAVFGQAEKDAVREALDSGLLGAGPIVARFETRIAERFGKRFGVAVNSGSSANLLALAALNLPPGSEVIGPATTVEFGDAAIMWASFYHLIFRLDPAAMKRQGIKEVLAKTRKAFDVPFRYFSSSRRRPGFREVDLSD